MKPASVVPEDDLGALKTVRRRHARRLRSTQLRREGRIGMGRSRVASALLRMRVEVLLRDMAQVDKYAVQLGSLRHALAPNWLGLPATADFKGNTLTLDVASLARVASQGIAVAWIPRPPVLAELLDVAPADLLGVVLDRQGDILEDCLGALGRSKQGSLAAVGELLTSAVETARAGYYPATQALAANVLDTVLRIACPLGRWQGYRRLREAILELRNTGSLWHLRTGLALAPVLLATEVYDGASNVVPSTYNRHATAHAAGGVQYSAANAIVALMAATSALRECDEAVLSRFPLNARHDRHPELPA
jgi:hypothetical protein